MDADRTELTTRGGVRVTRTATPFDPGELGRIAAIVDERRGGVMSSGMEYPGGTAAGTWPTPTRAWRSPPPGGGSPRGP